MILARCLVLKAVFHAVCSECGKEGPEELSTQEAHEAVIGLGWDYRPVFPEGERMTVYLCDACQEKTSNFNNSPIFVSPVDPDCEISDADPGL